ncbi:MAG: murein biosynthesis integral membrane protein MurJ [Elusimicrobia bacterium]|nr:murein biosynthesis integral membrane protein MurJ [Elusimicrobiota bacterium]
MDISDNQQITDTGAAKKVIARATVMITIIALVGKVFGFICSFILAAKFGATFKTDAYFVALNIPELLRDVLSGGALTCAFIPVYTTCLAKKQEQEAQKLASGIFNILLVALILLTLFGIIFAPALTHLVAPGFKGETLDLTIKLTRLFFPAIIFLGLASLFGAILNSYHHFTVPALQPLIMNTANIVGMLLLAPFIDIYSLVVGALVGGVGITMMNLPLLYKKGLRYLPQFSFEQEGIKKIGVLWFPLILGLSVNQLNIVISKILASGLSSGSISALNYANLINQIAPSVFGVAVSTAIFPSLSWHIALNENEKFREIVSKAIRVSLIITVPLTLGLMFLSFPVIRFLFERGVFDRQATILTSGLLVYFAIGTFALAVNYVLIRAFYALSDTKTPVKLAITAVVSNIVMSLLLITFMAQNGLALASSIAAMVQMGLLLIYLQRKIGKLKLKQLAIDFVKTVISGLISVGAGVFCLSKLSAFFDQNTFCGQILSLGIVGLVIIVLYLLWLSLFKVEQTDTFLDMIKKRWRHGR